MTDTNAGREAMERAWRTAERGAGSITTEHYAERAWEDLRDARAYVAELERAAAERDELRARCEKAELRTLALYTPLWEYGYDCHDYEAQAIVGEALQAKQACDKLRAEVVRLQNGYEILCADAVISAGRARELHGMSVKEQRALWRWLVEHQDDGHQSIEVELCSRLASAERVVEAARVWAGLAERHYHATATEVNEIANELRLAVRAHATASEEKTDG